MSSCQESSPLGDRQAHIYCVHVCACVCARGWVLEQSAPEGAHRQRGLEGACGMPALGSPAGLASMLGSFFPGRAPSTLDQHFGGALEPGLSGVHSGLGIVRASAGIPSKSRNTGRELWARGWLVPNRS